MEPLTKDTVKVEGPLNKGQAVSMNLLPVTLHKRGKPLYKGQLRFNEFKKRKPLYKGQGINTFKKRTTSLQRTR